MKFHFEFDIKKLPQPINHYHPLFLIGSCFTENIGEKLKRHKFQILENPNGILFNPVSVGDALTDYIENTKRDFLNSSEQSREKFLSSLDQIRDDLLSNALKIKDNYVSGVDTFKSAGRIKDESGKPQ